MDPAEPHQAFAIPPGAHITGSLPDPDPTNVGGLTDAIAFLAAAIADDSAGDASDVLVLATAVKVLAEAKLAVVRAAVEAAS